MKFNFNNPEYELNFNLFIKKINTVCVVFCMYITYTYRIAKTCVSFV